VGALHAEVLPLIWRLDRPRVVDRNLVTGLLAGRRVGVLRCGVGPERAERRTARVLADHDAARVLSLGTCGALIDDLVIGDIVCADRLFENTEPLAAPVPLGTARRLAATTVSAIVDSPAARERLAQAGAGICEMEAAAVSRAAGTRPVTVLKVVSDRAGAGTDPAFSGPRPVAMARMNLRALRLSRDRLTPAVIALLRDPTY